MPLKELVCISVYHISNLTLLFGCSSESLDDCFGCLMALLLGQNY